MSAKAQITQDLIHAKRAKGISFEELGKIIGRDEVAVAGIFYGQSFATEEELDKLAGALGLPSDYIVKEFSGFPNRGEGVEMPPREPLIYRLYEIVQNYGQAYKAVMNEKFGDGIMSAIAFSTKVDKEIDDQGVAWVNIYMRGKWLPYSKF